MFFKPRFILAVWILCMFTIACNRGHDTEKSTPTQPSSPQSSQTPSDNSPAAASQPQTPSATNQQPDAADDKITIPQAGSIEEQMASLTWKTIHNDRYQFNIDYPSFMQPMPVSDNGDGMTFRWKDMALIVWGENNLEDEDAVQSEYDNQVSFLGHDPVYKVIQSDYFIISDYDDEGNVFYRKSVLKDDVWYTMMFVFPKEYRKRIDKLIEKVDLFTPPSSH